MIIKGLAVYFYPEWSREIIVLGVFNNNEEMLSGQKPIKYQIHDQDIRLDTQDDTIVDFPSWDDVKTKYVKFF